MSLTKKKTRKNVSKYCIVAVVTASRTYEWMIRRHLSEMTDSRENVRHSDFSPCTSSPLRDSKHTQLLDYSLILSTLTFYAYEIAEVFRLRVSEIAILSMARRKSNKKTTTKAHHMHNRKNRKSDAIMSSMWWLMHCAHSSRMTSIHFSFRSYRSRFCPAKTHATLFRTIYHRLFALSVVLWPLPSAQRWQWNGCACETWIKKKFFKITASRWCHSMIITLNHRIIRTTRIEFRRME